MRDYCFWHKSEQCYETTYLVESFDERERNEINLIKHDASVMALPVGGIVSVYIFTFSQ